MCASHDSDTYEHYTAPPPPPQKKKKLYSWTSVIRPSVIRISLLSGHDLAVYCLLSILSIFNYSLAQDKNKVVNICFILLSNPFYTSDNLLQME